MANSFTPLAASSIVAGRGSLDFLGTFTGRRVAVIHGGPDVLPEKTGQRLISLVEGAGGKCMFTSPVLHEPFFSDIRRISGEIENYGPDLLVAVGGGAVIDTAKGAHRILVQGSCHIHVCRGIA